MVDPYITAQSRNESAGDQQEREFSERWERRFAQSHELAKLRAEIKLLRDVVEAAALVVNECDRPWSSGQRRLWTAVQALRKPTKRQDDGVLE